MIELREACFSFDGERNVVDHVSLTLSPGERLVLLGRNGSGKSTLARLLNGSLAPTSGEVVVDGRREGLARLVGYVRQDPRNQIVSAVVSDEVAFGPRNLGLPRWEVSARVDEALAACRGVLADEDMPWEAEPLQETCRALCEPLGMKPKALFQPLRVAVCGNMVSPPLFESIELLPHEDVLARIDATVACAFGSGQADAGGTPANEGKDRA